MLKGMEKTLATKAGEKTLPDQGKAEGVEMLRKTAKGQMPRELTCLGESVQTSANFLKTWRSTEVKRPETL